MEGALSCEEEGSPGEGTDSVGHFLSKIEELCYGVSEPKKSLKNELNILINCMQEANLGNGALSGATGSPPFSLRKKREKQDQSFDIFPFQRGCLKQMFSKTCKWTQVDFDLLEPRWQ